jgi:hypothetical protein
MQDSYQRDQEREQARLEAERQRREASNQAEQQAHEAELESSRSLANRHVNLSDAPRGFVAGR